MLRRFFFFGGGGGELKQFGWVDFESINQLMVIQGALGLFSWNWWIVVGCRSSPAGKVASSGERLQPSTHAPEPYAVHATEPSPSCSAHRHLVTCGDSPPWAGAGRWLYHQESGYSRHGCHRKVSHLHLIYLLFINAVSSSEYIVSNGGNTEYCIRKAWKEAVVAYIKPLSEHTSGGIEENHGSSHSRLLVFQR